MAGTADDFLAQHPELLDEDQTDLRVRRAIATIAAPMALYFRFQARGFERVPPGKCVLVANHNAAFAYEIPLIVRAWQQHWGDRPARGLAHQLNWLPPMSWASLFQKAGAVLAHPRVARRVLEKDQALLVYPGGELEALRPFSRRYEVDFAGRAGFVKLARQADACVVPIVTCGAHAPFVIVPGGGHVARWLGFRRFLGWKVFPLSAGGLVSIAALALALVFPALWPLWLASVLHALWPWPCRIEMEVLPPMRVLPEETDEQAAERVRLAMQEAMDRMAKMRWTWFG
jgi:1-acyl-sn-glycerol-3-phosphate acyltransferase